MSGAKASFVSLAMNLTFDIIGAVIMDVDLDAQQLDPLKRGELVRAFTELLDAYWNDKIHLPWWFNLSNELRRRRLGKRVERNLKSIVRRKHEEQQQGYREGQNPQSRSVLSLSLQDTKVLSQCVLDRSCDQLRTFLLGGHDSPSATLAWIFYELSRSPHVLSAVCAELDSLFGSGTDADAVRAQLASPAGPDLIGRMSYITAVIKETLRLHPPASTARYSPHDTGLAIRTLVGEELSLNGVITYNCNFIIHRDPAVYGSTAEQFMPERWLQNDSLQTIKDGPNSNPTTATAHQIPPSAWRPFERGPRGCIGQEFASIEIRVIIAVVSWQYEFTKVGLGAVASDASGRPTLGYDGQYEVKSHVYHVSCYYFFFFMTSLILFFSASFNPLKHGQLTFHRHERLRLGR